MPDELSYTIKKKSAGVYLLTIPVEVIMEIHDINHVPEYMRDKVLKQRADADVADFAKHLSMWSKPGHNKCTQKF